MSTPDLATHIRALACMDVGFTVSHESPHGTERISVTADELVQYAADPAAFLAAHYGVSTGDYLGWHRSGFCVKCAGTTSAGKRCRQTVPGGTNVSPLQWTETQGAYCHIHNGVKNGQ